MSAPTILVIEDNPSDIFALRYGLDHQEAEYVLQVLPDGDAALSFIAEHRAGIHQPDPCVILLDLYLPKQKCLEVLAALKIEPFLAHIKVIVLTSIASPKEVAQIRELGAVCRLKPARLEQYLELVAQIFELCKQGISPRVI
jgi:two-component system, chemotaxis family, response regulator Rcp1